MRRGAKSLTARAAAVPSVARKARAPTASTDPAPECRLGEPSAQLAAISEILRVMSS